ncbi:MAG: hypothetical protein WC707_03875 [Candidatus Babeliaceae bacterium]
MGLVIRFATYAYAEATAHRQGERNYKIFCCSLRIRSNTATGILLQAVTESTEVATITNILANPNAALANEVIDITAEFINKPASVVSEVIATAQACRRRGGQN